MQDKSKLIAVAVIVLLFALFLPTLIKSAKLLSPEVAPTQNESQNLPISDSQSDQDELQKQLIPDENQPDTSNEETGEAKADEDSSDNMDDIIPEDKDKIMPEDEFNINLLDFIKIPD